MNATPNKRSPPIALLPLALLLLTNVIPEAVSSGSSTFKAVLAPDRPPYFQCPQINTHIIYTYPLLTNPQCSNTFTYCAEQVSVPATCPWGMYFNPHILSCDHPIPDHCWVDQDEIIQPRPIVDDPSYNDCGRRPCNFFPNGEADDEGQTYVFCQFGKPLIRSCPKDYAFCAKKRDCVPKNEAHIFTHVEVTDGIREEGHPIPMLDEIASKDSMDTQLSTRGQTNPMSIEEQGLESVVIQTPIEDANATISNDSVWSPWFLCPNGTFLVTMDVKKLTCAPIGPGRNPTRMDKATEIYLSKRHRIYFPFSNCDKGNGGVMISYKLNRAARMVEFFCSNDHPPKGVDWCPATKAMCGVSFQNGKDKQVTNVRVKCCPVEHPRFFPTEELRFIDSLDNLEGSRQLNMEFSSVVGIDIPQTSEDKVMRMFYLSLGFTVDHVWDEIQRDLRANTTCIRDKEKVPCFYPWNNYTVVNRVGRDVKQRYLVPAKLRLNIYQVFAHAGYFTINTNLYVVKKEKARRHEATWYGFRPERIIDFGIRPPILAQNLSLEKVEEETMSAKEKAALFYEHLNFTPAPDQEVQDKSVSILSNPEGKEVGAWVELFRNCSKKYFVNTLKLGKGSSGGVVTNLEMGCTPILKKAVKVIRERRAAPILKKFLKKKKRKAKKVLRLEFNGGKSEKLGEDEMSDCDKGVAVGFQVKMGGGVTEDLKLVCSSQGSLVKNEDGWTDVQACEPMYAISGFSARFTDKGLSNFKVRCQQVPAAASKCKPKWSTRLVATCTTTEANSSCIFKVPLGVSYRLEKPHHQDTANLMESIGHTLNCSYTPLARRFRKKYRSDKHWKEDFYYPITTVTGQIFQLPVGIIELHQVTGKCGPYIVYTNRFVKSRTIPKEKDEEEEFTLPLPPGPTLPPCAFRELAAVNKKKNLNDVVSKKAGPTKIYTIKQQGRNHTFYIQRPPRWAPSPDAIWSKWMECNNTKGPTHVSEVRVDGILCQPISDPGEKPPPKNITRFIRHRISGLSLNSKDCNKLGGGAIIGFKKQQGQPTEYQCSISNSPQTAKEEWCPPMTAMCGLSIQYSPKLLKVENLRIKCCKVSGPNFNGGKEQLVHVYTFDNSDRDVWRKFKFLAAYEGAIVHESDKAIGQYWQSLGFTWKNVWEIVEDGIIYNVTCYDPDDTVCLYPWSEFMFQSPEMTQVQKRILVPPKCILKLHQIYVQVGFYRVYIKRYIELINDTAHNALYEEVRDILVEHEESHEEGHHDMETIRNKISGPGPIHADNITADDYKDKLKNLTCTYHNYKGKIDQDSKIDDSEWLTCDEGMWLGKARFEKDGKGRTQDIDYDCKGLKLTRSGPYITADDNDPNLVDESTIQKINHTKKVPVGYCENGFFSGFQNTAGEFELLCSCKEEDQKRGIWPSTDKIVCDPFYALKAIRPFYSSPTGKDRDRTLTGLKKVCTKVPSMAESCVPKEVETKVLVAKCDNEEDISRECTFKINVGITYNLHSDHNINLANALESVGYTIPCVTPVLAKKFQKLESPVWREPFWFRLTELVGRVTNLQPNSETEIYQVVGRCGPYVIHTNKFIQEDTDVDIELDLPLYDDPDVELCWQDKNYKFPEEKEDIGESIITEM